MSELHVEVKKVHDRYEKANAEFEVERIAALYADVFMFGNPEGVQSVKKEDFVRVLPQRKEFFRSMGLLSPKIDSPEASKLDSKYVLVKAVWRMRFERRTGEPLDSQNSTTYILSASSWGQIPSSLQKVSRTNWRSRLRPRSAPSND
jgi:hypothetical protein